MALLALRLAIGQVAGNNPIDSNTAWQVPKKLQLCEINYVCRKKEHDIGHSFFPESMTLSCTQCLK